MPVKFNLISYIEAVHIQDDSGEYPDWYDTDWIVAHVTNGSRETVLYYLDTILPNITQEDYDSADLIMQHKEQNP